MKMKSLVAALALGVASVGANAAITLPTTANGELFFTVYDLGADVGSNADDRAYVRDLGSLANGPILGGSLNNWATATTTSTVIPDKQGFGTIFSLAADANLQSFLAASTDTNRLKWNIYAGDNSGAARVLTTASSIATNQLPTNQGATLANGSAAGWLANINPTLGVPPAPQIESALFSAGGAALSQWGDNVAGRFTFSNAGNLGDSLGFFLLSTGNSATSLTLKPALTQYMADGTTAMEWTLAANGNLTYGATAVTAPIPEPETYGMLLAGLGMIGFMARRRLANRA